MSTAQRLYIEITVGRAKSIIVRHLTPLALQNDTISGEFNLIAAGIDNSLLNEEFDAASLAGQLQGLVQIPAIASKDIQDRLNLYNTLIDLILDLLPDKVVVSGSAPPLTDEDINVTVIVELITMAIMVAMSTVITTGPFQTRAQAIEAGDFLQDSLDRITDRLDLLQSVSEISNILEMRYTSLAQSRTDVTQLVGAVVRYLLLLSFNLKVERRIILKEPRAPIEIAITEYGSLGENDSNFDKLLETNNLKGDDRLWLAAGREIVIYG
ncbi:MAG: hypothetical protein ACTSPB_07825 [Candidatus Thorarchaeota archaeon]